MYDNVHDGDDGDDDDDDDDDDGDDDDDDGDGEVTFTFCRSCRAFEPKWRKYSDQRLSAERAASRGGPWRGRLRKSCWDLLGGWWYGGLTIIYMGEVGIHW